MDVHKEPSATIETRPTFTESLEPSPTVSIEVLQLVVENLYLSRPREANDGRKTHKETDKSWGKLRKSNGKTGINRPDFDRR